MVNTLHGPFVAGGATATGHYGVGVGQVNTYSSGNVNYDETQSAIALHSFNPHLIGAGFVLSGAVCTKDGVNANQLDIASGEAYLIQTDGTLALCDIGADNTHTTTGNPSTTMYLDLNPDGTWSWATSHSVQANYLPICQVTTDASANIATVTDARPLSTTFLSPAQGLHVGQPGAVGSGITQAFLRLGGAVSSYLNDSYIGTYADVAGGGGAFLYLVLAADKGIIFTQKGIGGGNLFAVGLTPTSGVKSWIDQAGALHATAPVQLISGNQETGPAGFRGGVNAAGDFFGGMVNFKTVMTNTPTSITLAITIGTQNVAGVASASQITKNGFLLQWATTTSSNTFWLGSYTTVGNCLLAVDTTAQTLDHHCDACGHLSLAAPFNAVTHDVQFNEPVMSYGCPTCGAVECFNTLLTSADEADTTPQGAGDYATTRGAQAQLIRALMGALEMAVA